MQQDAPTPDRKQLLKMAIDLGPLLVFFAAYMTLGIYWATGALMAATIVSMIASWLLLGHISATLIVTTALVVGFGALTLLFNDARFIKMKPTIVNLLFAGFLFGGLLLKRPVLQHILGEAMRLTDVGWRKLSVRWAFFFLAMAVLNEIVWRNFSEATWASFKVFGILPLTLGFAVLQIGLMRRHEEVPASPSGRSPPA
ncbi:MAG: septation protein A [Hyphomicrobiaceae bacterium]